MSTYFSRVVHNTLVLINLICDTITGIIFIDRQLSMRLSIEYTIKAINIEKLFDDVDEEQEHY